MDKASPLAASLPSSKPREAEKAKSKEKSKAGEVGKDAKDAKDTKEPAGRGRDKERVKDGGADGARERGRNRDKDKGKKEDDKSAKDKDGKVKDKDSKDKDAKKSGSSKPGSRKSSSPTERRKTGSAPASRSARKRSAPGLAQPPLRRMPPQGMPAPMGRRCVCACATLLRALVTHAHSLYLMSGRLCTCLAVCVPTPPHWHLAHRVPPKPSCTWLTVCPPLHHGPASLAAGLGCPPPSTSSPVDTAPLLLVLAVAHGTCTRSPCGACRRLPTALTDLGPPPWIAAAGLLPCGGGLPWTCAECQEVTTSCLVPLVHCPLHDITHHITRALPFITSHYTVILLALGLAVTLPIN